MVDEPQSLLAMQTQPRSTTSRCSPGSSNVDGLRHFRFLGRMAADARNVLACGWQAKLPLAIDKVQHVAEASKNCMPHAFA